MLLKMDLTAGWNAHLLGLLLELLDGPLVNATALVDQMAGGGGLARVHVADDHDVDVNLFLAHGGGGERSARVSKRMSLESETRSRLTSRRSQRGAMIRN